MSAKNQRSLALLALACGACLDFGSSAGVGTDETTIEVTPPRVLDTLCAQGAYTLTGAAVRRAGLTPDSCGFELGPGDGSVTFSTSGSPEETLGSTTELRALVVDLEGGAHAARWVALTPVPDSTAALEPRPDTRATTSFTVSSGGRHLGLLDVEGKITIPPYSGGCSVARARGPERPRP